MHSGGYQSVSPTAQAESAGEAFFLAKNMRKVATIEERFSKKYDVDPNTGCWNWNAAIKAHGYGGFMVVRGKSSLAHRVSYELHIGEIPKGEGPHGTCVCHRCDNRLCVNPSHLFLGSNKENHADMMKKGRDKHPSGDAHGRAKLTSLDVIELRKIKAAGFLDVTAAARRLHVTKTTIQYAVQRKTWRTI